MSGLVQLSMVLSPQSTSLPRVIEICLPVPEKEIVSVLTIYGLGNHLDHVTWIIYINFRFHFLWLLHMKFDFD